MALKLSSQKATKVFLRADTEISENWFFLLFGKSLRNEERYWDGPWKLKNPLYIGEQAPFGWKVAGHEESPGSIQNIPYLQKLLSKSRLCDPFFGVFLVISELGNRIYIEKSEFLIYWVFFWIFFTYIPLSPSKFASYFGNFNSKFSKFSKFWEKIPKFWFFSQNFQNHRGAATEIKGAAASLLVNSKISILYQELPQFGVYNIKHNLARSCFQFWLSKSAPRVTKFREKNCLG